MKKAFTLAEVLITLTIVGTIAALTVPQVIQDYKYKLYTTQLKKVYAEVSEAVETAKTNENTDHFYQTKAFSETSNADVGAQFFLTNYFAHIDADTAANLASPAEGDLQFTSMDDAVIESNLIGGIGYCIKTKSSSIICANYDEGGVLNVVTDVNGLKNPPNTAGRDIFSMHIDAEGIISDADTECGEGEEESPFTASAGCLRQIIEDNWQMEY
ncbi:prepilin-type N-terminal cleavage/methylation domain-containing protein [bacterium]|nr:prepilin-type N-terminal cleavage/methylation domain-containing protein [bacterium]